MADILHGEDENDIDFDAIDQCISEKKKEKIAEKRKRDDTDGGEACDLLGISKIINKKYLGVTVDLDALEKDMMGRDEIAEKMDAIDDGAWEPDRRSMYDSDWEGTYDDAWGPAGNRDNSEGYVLSVAKSSPGSDTDDIMDILKKVLHGVETLTKRMNTLEEKMNLLIETSTQ
jgi:hypothetical protein